MGLGYNFPLVYKAEKMDLIKKVLSFFRDRDYYRTLFRLALPIALQNLITSSLTMIAVLFIGQLGETAVASVSLANQIFFLLNLMVFGVVSGCAIFIAQLWGKKDVHNIRRVVGLTIKLALGAALVFTLLGLFFPQMVLHIYSNDPEVIKAGSSFLRIICWTYGFFSLTVVFSTALRSTGNVRLPLFVSTSALVVEVALAFPLIFGVKWLGLPALGINGFAIAALIARILECGAMLYFVYRDKQSPVRVGLKELFDWDWKFIVTVLKPVLPVIGNETLWSLGITTYNAIYGHISTDAIAAMNMVATIDQIAFVIFLSLGTSTSIMVGNLIGKGERAKAFTYAGRSLVLQMSGAMLMGVIVYLFAGNIFLLYKVSPAVIADARQILTVVALAMWIRASNHVIIIGILRAGGDTKFSLVLDGLVIWLIGVPVTAIGAFVFHLPIYYVYALTLSEEIVKASVGLWRFFSRRWINDLTHRVEAISPLDAV
jgi:putative MATE family efflux protein